MKTILLLLCLTLFASCTINRYLPNPTTTIVTPAGTFVTFSTRTGNWIIIDTAKTMDPFGYRITVVPIKLKRNN